MVSEIFLNMKILFYFLIIITFLIRKVVITATSPNAIIETVGTRKRNSTKDVSGADGLNVSVDLDSSLLYLSHYILS